MPPSIDAYVLLAERSAAMIDRFVSAYGTAGRWQGALFDNDLARDAHRVIERCLSNTHLSATIYPRARDPRFTGLVVHFTNDGALVLGASIDDPLNEESAAQLAAEVVNELSSSFDTSLAGGIHEWVPPSTQEAFEADLRHSGQYVERFR